MLTNKLLAAVGLAGSLLLGASTDASANPWHRPIYRAPVVVAPVYRAPIYRTPVFVPVPRVVVYPAYPVYGPVYHPVGWRHPHWVRHHGRHW